CKTTKPISEFIKVVANGKERQYGTCANCRSRTTECKNSKKRQLEITENENQTGDQETEDQEIESQETDDDLEIIDPINLCNYIMLHLNAHSIEIDDNLESVSPPHFQCCKYFYV
ncbi:10701_t:CDS:1, partial [Cetraspora pellucida]